MFDVLLGFFMVDLFLVDGLGNGLSELFFGDVLWNVENEDVGLESLLHALGDGWHALGHVVNGLVDELLDDDHLAVDLLLHVETFNGVDGSLVVVVHNEGALLLGDELHAGDFTVLGEDLSDLCFGGVFSQVADVKVEEVI